MAKQNRSWTYEDIVSLPHHVSATRPHMPAMDRAAQFSPFAALTGHEAAISETARLTEERPELDEMEKERLDEKLLLLKKLQDQQPEITVTWFVPDERKRGGACQTLTGCFARTDELHRLLCLTDGTAIPLLDILDIRGICFLQMEEI